MNNNDLAIEFTKIMQDMGEVRTQKHVLHVVRGKNLILAYLNNNQDKSITSGDISLELNLTTARIAAALKQLEDDGSIIRMIDPLDKRRTLVSITNEGILKSNENRSKMIGSIENMFNSIGTTDAKEFIRISRKIYQYVINNFTEEELKDV